MNNLLILIITSLLFAACNKEPEYKTMYLDAGLKAAFNNKPGSYWIYKDSVTGELDSLFLVSNRLTIDEGYTTTHGAKYEMMYLDYGSKHLGPDTSYNLSLAIYFSTRDNNLFASALNRISIQPLNFWFSYPFNSLGPISKEDSLIYSKMPTSLLLGANQFNNVTMFTQTKKNDLLNGSTGFWSDEKGLIKMRFLCKSAAGPMIRVLELQRWKLIK